MSTVSRVFWSNGHVTKAQHVGAPHTPPTLEQRCVNLFPPPHQSRLYNDMHQVSHILSLFKLIYAIELLVMRKSSLIVKSCVMVGMLLATTQRWWKSITLDNVVSGVVDKTIGFNGVLCHIDAWSGQGVRFQEEGDGGNLHSNKHNQLKTIRGMVDANWGMSSDGLLGQWITATRCVKRIVGVDLGEYCGWWLWVCEGVISLFMWAYINIPGSSQSVCQDI